MHAALPRVAIGARTVVLILALVLVAMALALALAGAVPAVDDQLLGPFRWPSAQFVEA